VLAVHRDGRAPRPEGLSDTLTPDQLRAYIAEAKQHQPFIPEDLTGAPHSSPVLTAGSVLLLAASCRGRCCWSATAPGSGLSGRRHAASGCFVS
jgi:hypothetical protein